MKRRATAPPYPSPPTTAADASTSAVVAATKVWLERAVIGLNLCPFAKAEFVNERIRYHVSPARSQADLLRDLADELTRLAAADPQVCETTLLIQPEVLSNFAAYNQFLDNADAVLRCLQLEGTFQIASFHPRYQFAGTDVDDITNFTNRSPHPMLHLLREASVARAVAGYPDASHIVERNLATLRRLGAKGWRELGIPGEVGRTPPDT